MHETPACNETDTPGCTTPQVSETNTPACNTQQVMETQHESESFSDESLADALAQ